MANWWTNVVEKEMIVKNAIVSSDYVLTVNKKISNMSGPPYNIGTIWTHIWDFFRRILLNVTNFWWIVWTGGFFLPKFSRNMWWYHCEIFTMLITGNPIEERQINWKKFSLNLFVCFWLLISRRDHFNLEESLCCTRSQTISIANY